MFPIIFAIFFLLIGCANQKVDWHLFEKPTQTSSQAVGSYSHGCLLGGRALALSSEHYQIMNQKRNRFYGHPQLIEFINQHAHEVYKVTSQKILVGDLSQPRGGLMSYGHNSHQTGLDVDIWFLRVKPENLKIQDIKELEKQGAPIYLDTMGMLNTAKWTEKEDKVLSLAAQNPKVSRIFVNPHIKQRFCDRYPNEKWIQKIRPWWKHHGHYHVRLNCPKDNKLCQKQAALPKGLGCDKTLAWWFTKDAVDELQKKKTHTRKKPEMPELCKKMTMNKSS